MQRLLKAIYSTVFSFAIITVMCFTVLADGSSPIDLYDEWSVELKQYTQQLCTKYEVDYSLVLAIIYNESRFQSELVHENNNGTKDYGLMQVNEINFEWLYDNLGIESMDSLLVDEVGLECGVALLAYHIEAAGSTELGLLRYQVGAGQFNRMINQGQYSNDTYEQVVDYWNEYKAHFGLTNGLIRKLINNLPDMSLKWAYHNTN